MKGATSNRGAYAPRPRLSSINRRFPGKAVLAHLLLARIALQVGDPAEAQKETDESLAADRSPSEHRFLAYQAHLLQGQRRSSPQ